MLDDILKTARQQVIERLTSPLLGSFTIAWCLWNYKFLVILFSAASVSRTFELVDKLAFPDNTALVLRGIILPAATAAAYIFLYPYPARFVYGFTLRRQRETNSLRQSIESETLLSVEESRRIRSEIVAIEDRQRAELDKLNAEIGRLRSQLDAATKESSSSVNFPASQTVPALTPSQVLLLMLIEKSGGKMTEASIVSRSQESKVKTEFDLGELEGMKLLHKNYDQSESDYTYEFTHDGRRTVLAASVDKPSP